MEKDNFKKILEDFEIKYKSQLAQKEGLPKYDLSAKINDIYQLATNKIVKKCHKEIEELNNYLENDFLSDKEIKPIKGKENEAKEKYFKFFTCSYHMNSIINKFENISQFSTSLNSYQLNLCKEDCIENTKDQNTEMGKLCMKKCLDFSFKYTRKANYDLVENVLENIENEIKRY